ncbi:MAG: hypothetical protein WAZ18_06910 [Alphaproteobacteria bacterium]
MSNSFKVQCENQSGHVIVICPWATSKASATETALSHIRDLKAGEFKGYFTYKVLDSQGTAVWTHQRSPRELHNDGSYVSMEGGGGLWM